MHGIADKGCNQDDGFDILRLRGSELDGKGSCKGFGHEGVRLIPRHDAPHSWDQLLIIEQLIARIRNDGAGKAVCRGL